MQWWRSLLLACCAVSCVFVQSEEEMMRETRSFPYSVSLYRMLGHDRELRPYMGENDEVAALIDGLNSGDMPRLRRSGSNMKRYACRFKFCRIYDA